MNSPRDSKETKRPCGLSLFIPLGMSCRGRAEAFARRLQSKLRTLGSQESTTQPISTNTTETTCLAQPAAQQTNHQAITRLSHEADSYFDFDIEPESPGSPIEECEYSRLIETASTTPQDAHSESGYVCSSSTSSCDSSTHSRSSSDGQYFDPESSEIEQKSLSLSVDYYDCIDLKRDLSEVQNGRAYPIIDSDSCSESLPNSQSTTTSLSAGTPASSSSNNTLQDVALNELYMLSKEQYEHENIYDNICEPVINGLDALKLQESIPISNLQLIESLVNTRVIDSTPETSPEPENSKTEDESNNKTHLAVLPEEDEDFMRPQRLRRCSSLKSGKTPPGTPGTPSRKKFVRFADVLGLDLADVKTFMDEIPTVPKSAYEDLEVTDPLEQQTIETPCIAEKLLVPMFQQPGGMPGFLDIVREQQVCLENAAVTDPICMTITGCVRVRNLDFNKSVHLRYTLDGWQSFADFQANYIDNSCDGFSDKFSFTVFGNSLQIGQRIEMAVRFSCRGQQFWDNNFGANYCFQCLSSVQNAAAQCNGIQSFASLSPQDSWSGTFY